MNQNLKKINTEYKKNAAKIAELQARQAELEKQRTALENTEIIGLVRTMGLNPDQLAAIIRSAHSVQTATPEGVPEREEGGNHAEG